MATKVKNKKTLAQFDEELRELAIEGHWHVMDLLSQSLLRDAQPWIWHWRDVYPKLLEAGEIFAMDQGGAEARRTLRLITPGMPFRGTTHTVHVSVQLVQPGEVAPAHRHTMGAFRLALQGKGAYTAVAGERFPMEPGDLIVTPAWTWHDHHNESDQPFVWMDGLDLPLIVALQSAFFEGFDATEHQITKPDGHMRRKTGPMRPATGDTYPSGVPFRYSGKEAIETLRALGEDAADPFDGYTLDYVNPLTGGPVMPTTACRLHRLKPAQTTASHRHTASTIYHVMEGSGTTLVGGTTLSWQKGATFVIPMWRWHHHVCEGAGEAVLFSVGDDPVFRALAQYRMEAA